MAKFYVQSGTLKAVVDSVDARRAALWAVHQAMQQIAPIGPESSSVDIETNEQANALASAQKYISLNFISLGDSIFLSEIGFDQEDSISVDTFEAFREWHSLWNALEKLDSLL